MAFLIILTSILLLIREIHANTPLVIDDKRKYKTVGEDLRYTCEHD